MPFLFRKETTFYIQLVPDSIFSQNKSKYFDLPLEVKIIRQDPKDTKAEIRQQTSWMNSKLCIENSKKNRNYLTII